MFDILPPLDLEKGFTYLKTILSCLFTIFQSHFPSCPMLSPPSLEALASLCLDMKVNGKQLRWEVIKSLVTELVTSRQDKPETHQDKTQKETDAAAASTTKPRSV